jgi:hypothetical protein
MDRTQVNIARVGLSLPCCVPVLPGTSDTDAPLEERTEKCHVDAFWIIGRAPTCDIHLRTVCRAAEWGFDELVEEAGGPWPRESVPWADRHRYAQDDPASGMIGD